MPGEWPPTPETGQPIGQAEEHDEALPLEPVRTPEQEEEQLQDEFRNRAIAWLQERGYEDIVCPICKHDMWNVTGPVALPQHTLRKGPTFPLIAPFVYPAFQLICTTCGHTLLFNAVVAGLLPPRGESPTPTPESPETSAP